MSELLTVTVAEIREVASGIKSFELRAASGDALPAFEPGAHIDVHLASDLVRQYSLCGDPRWRDRYLLAVKEEPESRGGSRHMHRALRPGDALTIGRPRNNFPLAPGATRHILFAGGIGITPLFSMARHLAADGAGFEMHCFFRSEAHAAFREELEFAVFRYGDSPESVSAYAAEIIAGLTPSEHVYVCGPWPFMNAIAGLAGAHLPAESVHLEHFSADASALGPRGDDTAFTVRLARSGREIAVAADQSIVAALDAAGIAPPTYCREGLCGTCVTEVMAGTPDHRDALLPPEEHQKGDKMLICVSRSLTPLLVLDL
jgi:vanillate O-demethylase ferredoxin subunit